MRSANPFESNPVRSAFGDGLFAILLGISQWGLHMGFIQGVLSSLIARTAPERLRGTAFGLFGLITDLATLVASVTAGILWEAISPEAAFFTGTGLSGRARIAFLVLRTMRGSRGL